MKYNDLMRKYVSMGVRDSLYRNPYGYRSQDEDKSIVNSLVFNSDLVKASISNLQESNLNYFFKTSVEIGESVFNNGDSFWDNYIDETLMVLSKDKSELIQKIIRGRDEADLIITLLSQKQDYDWSATFLSMIEKLESHKPNWYATSVFNLFSSYLERDPSNFQKDIKAVLFDKKSSLQFQIRGNLYRLYAEGGFCTKKEARKMRSDGSEEASLAGLKSIIENSDIYENPVDLYLQFTDSRYEPVLQQLAENLPIHLLPSIMGTDSYWVKKKIEDRMADWETQGEQ